MDAAQVLTQAAALGVTIAPGSSPGKLRLSGPPEALAKIKLLVLECKPELLRLVAANDGHAERHARWLVAYHDRKIEVWTSPAATREEVLAGRPDAISAEPIQNEPAPEPAYPPRLDPELEARIRRMARRWQYSPDELADVLRRAARDPGVWLAVIEADEALARGKGRGVHHG